MREIIKTCDYCDGEFTFEIEPPDYDVGIMGYVVIMDTSFDGHAPDCEMRNASQEELDKISDIVAQDLSSGYYDEPPFYMVDY